MISEAEVVDWFYEAASDLLEEPVGMGSMEKIIDRVSLECRRQVLERRVQEAADREELCCPRCLQPLSVEEHHRARRVNSTFGLIRFTRGYGSCKACEEYFYTETIQRGLLQADEVLILADGAIWIWNIAEDRFKDATQRVDMYHVREHLWDLANEVPAYCAHCAKNEQILTSILGYPAYVTEFDPDPNKPCGWTFYKSLADIPERYYERIGRRKRGPARLALRRALVRVLARLA